MADWTRQNQQHDRDYDRNRYEDNYRGPRNYGEQTGDYNRDWENRQVSGRDYGEQWNPEHWQNRQQNRDWEQNRNRDWEQNRNLGQNQPSGGYRGYDTRSRNEYETGDFGTRNYGGSSNYGGVQRTVYGGRDYSSEQNRYGRDENYRDPRREYGNYWGGGTDYDRGQQSRWGGTNFGNYGTTYGSSTYGTPNYGGTTYGGGLQNQGRGNFAGRGPKNFNRTDERIREDAIERLTLHPDIDASEVDVQVKSGELTLTGTVDDREQRRMAEDLCENIWGVRDVHNQIKVNKPSLWERMTGQGETTATGEKTKKDKAA